MADWIVQQDLLGPIMFVVAFALIFTGVPVAFALGGTAVIFASVGVYDGYFDWSLMQALPERVFGIMANYVLLAVPFFIFMGTMLEKSRLAEDLLETIGMLFGRVRGGLALAVIFVGALLAAATGVVGASVVAMGLISLPIMLRNGYSAPLATGVIAASGTLGQIIPPSVVLVVLADQLGVSVGDLFTGSLVPGLLLTALYMVFVVVYALVRPQHAPALLSEKKRSAAQLLKRVLLVMVPPLLLIVLVLGSIFAGIATPTEAGALGAVGASILAAVRGRLSLPALRETARATMRLTVMVMFLLIGSTAFSLVFRGVYGDFWVEDMLTNLPGGELGFLLVAHAAVFGLGFFLDFFEIAFILLPMLLPSARMLGIDLVWFGVMLGMNLQTSFLTPPFGFALFYLRSVTPKEVPTTAIYRGAIPFIALQLVGLAAVWAFPSLIGR